MDRKKHGGKILRFLFVCFVLEQNLFDEALIDMFIFIFFTLFLKKIFNLWCFIFFFNVFLFLYIDPCIAGIPVTSQTTLIYFSIISIMEELVVPFSSFPTTLSFLWK